MLLHDDLGAMWPCAHCPLTCLDDPAQEVVASKGHSAEVAAYAGGTIRTFGSFRLGVNNKSGDIDLLVLGAIFSALSLSLARSLSPLSTTSQTR